jgi:aldehyde:ferredoxin oxidoreductase
MFKNLTDPGRGQPLHDSFARDLPQWIVEPQPSFNCTIACAYNAKITTGPCAGFTAQLDGGGENLEPAALLGVEDAGTVLMLADYWDDMGIDASIPAAVIAALMEMYEKGLISSEDIDGIDLTWGNFEAVMELVDKMIAREGVGAKLATKMTDAVRAIHPDGGQFLVHIKGGGMNLHDWRGAWNILFSDMVAGAGPSWQGLGVGEKDLIGEAGNTPPFDPSGKAAAVKASQPKKVWEDSLGICWFAAWGVEDSLNLTSKALAAATGWSDFTADEALTVGDRITNMMRLMYAKRGFKKEDEFEVGSKLTGGMEDMPESAMAPHVQGMIDEYYELMGWDVATGRPKIETIRKLGLEEFAEAAGVS